MKRVEKFLKWILVTSLMVSMVLTSLPANSMKVYATSTTHTTCFMFLYNGSAWICGSDVSGHDTALKVGDTLDSSMFFNSINSGIAYLNNEAMNNNDGLGDNAVVVKIDGTTIYLCTSHPTTGCGTKCDSCGLPYNLPETCTHTGCNHTQSAYNQNTHFYSTGKTFSASIMGETKTAVEGRFFPAYNVSYQDLNQSSTSYLFTDMFPSGYAEGWYYYVCLDGMNYVMVPCPSSNITFKNNNGEADTVVAATSISFPSTNPTYSNHLFGGWYTDEALTTVATSGTEVSEDTTIYAKWYNYNQITADTTDLTLDNNAMTEDAAKAIKAANSITDKIIIYAKDVDFGIYKVLNNDNTTSNVTFAQLKQAISMGSTSYYVLGRVTAAEAGSTNATVISETAFTGAAIQLVQGSDNAAEITATGTIYFRVGTTGSWSTSIPKRTYTGSYDVYYKMDASEDGAYAAVAETKLGTAVISNKANYAQASSTSNQTTTPVKKDIVSALVQPESIQFIEINGTTLSTPVDVNNYKAQTVTSALVRVASGFEYADGELYDLYVKFTNVTGSGTWQASYTSSPSYLTFNASKKGESPFGYDYEAWLIKAGEANTMDNREDFRFIGGSCYMNSTSEYCRPWSTDNYVYVCYGNQESSTQEKKLTYTEGLGWKWNGNYDKGDVVTFGNGTTSENSIKGGYTQTVAGRGSEMVFGYVVSKDVVTYVKYITKNGTTVEVPINVSDFPENQPITIKTPDEVQEPGYHITGWVSNKDVTLSDGTTIAAGETITAAQANEIILNGDMELKAEDANYAVHGYAYTATDNVMQIYCDSLTTCPYYGTTEHHENAISLTLEAEDALYTGNPVEATISNDEIEAYKTFTGATSGPTIEYSSDGTNWSTTAPSAVGSYTARISMGGAIATTTFEIKSLNGNITAAPTAATLTYNGEAQALLATEGLVTGTTMQYSLSKDGPFSDVIPTGTEAGTYHVYYKGKGDGYTVFDVPITVVIEKATYGDKVIDDDIWAHYASTGSITLPDIPENMVYGTPTFGADVDSKITDFTIIDNTMSFKYTNAIENGNDYVITIPVQGQDGANYKDFNITLTLTGKPCPAPTGTITIKDKTWTSFQNVVNFDLNYTEAQSVTITGADTGTGVDKILYYISENKALTLTEVKALSATSWTTYTEAFTISPTKKCVVYAKIICKAGEVTYISSDGLTFGSNGSGSGSGDDSDVNGLFEKDILVDPEAPIDDARFENEKAELYAASGILDASEKAAIDNGAEARVYLEITDLPEENITTGDKNKIIAAAKEELDGDLTIEYMDISLFKQVGTDPEKTIHNPGIDIDVTITLPASLVLDAKGQVRRYRIIRLHDGETDIISGKFNKETREFTFATDHFSTYAIAYDDVAMGIEINIPDGETTTLEKIGDTLQLDVVVTPAEDADQAVTFTSSNEKVATVSQTGLVTAVGDGTADITVTTADGAVSKTITIKVDTSGQIASTAAAKTGDANNSWLWILILALGMASIGCVTVKSKSYKKKH